MGSTTVAALAATAMATTAMTTTVLLVATLAAASCPAQLLAQQPSPHPTATQEPGQAQPAATLTGEVVDAATGRPVSEAEVRLSGVAAPQVTDADGGFRFGDVAPGLHRLTVRHLAYGTVSDTLTLGPGQRVSVRFQVGQSAIPLRPLVVTGRSNAEHWWSWAQQILGRLVDAATGRPVPYGFITLISPGGDTLETAVSDTAGRFRMMPPDSGHYRLRATALGYDPSLSAPVAVARQQQLQVELKMGASPFALDPLTVTARRDWRWWRSVKPARKWGFWERRELYGAKFGMGRFFTHQQIIEWAPATTIIQAYGRPIPMPECRSGRPVLIIDGHQAQFNKSSSLRGKLNPNWLPINDADIDDMEIYHTPGDMPPDVFEMADGSFCGAVLVWTK